MESTQLYVDSKNTFTSIYQTLITQQTSYFSLITRSIFTLHIYLILLHLF